jgi:predicted TIM-barrel fold metal-dependent hydrolase
VPETTLVLDHFGTPLGVGIYTGKREEIFEVWQRDIAAIARQPNVVAKLGGLAMPDNGFGWDRRERPASSDELVEAQARYYHHTIECFGPSRCMFESNFPVDRRSLSYNVYWNAMKKLASRYSADEQHAMFYGTAAKVYRL